VFFFKQFVTTIIFVVQLANHTISLFWCHLFNACTYTRRWVSYPKNDL